MIISVSSSFPIQPRQGVVGRSMFFFSLSYAKQIGANGPPPPPTPFPPSKFRLQFTVFNETTFQKLELVLSWATLPFVGWVEPTPGFVGFRCTQTNLHFAGVIAKCKTQQRPDIHLPAITRPASLPPAAFGRQPGPDRGPPAD